MEQEEEYYDVFLRKVVEDEKLIFPKKFNLVFNPHTKAWIHSPLPTMDYINYLKKSQRELFYSQYMNDPSDPEDQLFQRDYFQTYDYPPGNLFIALAVDLALSERNYSDYTGLVVGGMDNQHRIYILDTLRGKWGHPADIIDSIFMMVEKWKPQVVGLEVNGYQKVLKYALEDAMRFRKKYFPIQEIKTATTMTRTHGEKYHIRALEPYYKNRLVYHAKWMDELENELSRFPKGRHDDLADAEGMLLEMLVPGGTEAVFRQPGPGTWEYEAREARQSNANSPYDFINRL